MFEAAELGKELDEKTFEKEVPPLRVRLVDAQYDLLQADFPVILLIAGDDQAGCEDVIDRLHEWMDARHLQLHVFERPTEVESERPRFWRYWNALPRRGRIGIFAGAWAMNAIADRLEKRIGKGRFARRLEHVRRFERALVDDGALLVKIWLHLPREAFHESIDKARKRLEEAWDIVQDSWIAKDRYEKAIALSERFLRETDGPTTPWPIVESTDPRHRDATVGRIIAERIEQHLRRDRSSAAAVTSDEEGLPTGEGILRAVDPAANGGSEDYENELAKLQKRLAKLSLVARRSELSTVLVFEGMDAAGKGGAIRRITRALSARDYAVHPIGAPTEEELAHHYLWRFWRRLPRAGRMTIFDRSWYGRVLVERVEGLTPEADWRRAYAEIRDFEDQIVEHGIVLRKFWLHIDPQTQLARFEERKRKPFKRYKLTDDDLRNRSRWDDYVQAADEMIARTSTDTSPWKIVPANDKHAARLTVLRTVYEDLRRALS